MPVAGCGLHAGATFADVGGSKEVARGSRCVGLAAFRPDPSLPMSRFSSLRIAGRRSLRLAALCALGSLSAGVASVRASDFPAPTPPPALPTGPVTASDAARLLTQATFGPTDDEIRKVQAAGITKYLQQQFNTPATSHVAYLQQLGFPLDQKGRQLAELPWWQNAVNAPDQLRQRVAFALSEIMVVSGVGPGERPYGLSGYMDVLCQDAFGNFYDLLHDVTLSPEMGTYLNVAGNEVGDPKTGTHPDENYAREAMQLFTIGLDQLNPDGTPQLDADGQSIPTYTQDTVTAFARVYTGWTYAPVAGSAVSWKDKPNWLAPMVSVAKYHDTGAKTLLNGETVKAGGTAESDLKAALYNIFNHPNVGPFFCQRLIQRLVTSNPSPGYVYRVASVFDDNGHGKRGDLKAVLTAILTDYEARSAGWAAGPDYGKQREPVIRLTNIMRAFHATSTQQNFPLVDTTDSLGESPLQAPSVFNFFAPAYTVPGKIAEKGLVAPEFQITTESTAISSANVMYDLIYGNLGQGKSGQVVLDLSAVEALAAAPDQVTAYLNNLLMAGQMSTDMQNTLTTAIATIPAGDVGERARSAVQIVATSPEFVIQK